MTIKNTVTTELEVLFVYCIWIDMIRYSWTMIFL